MLHIDRFSRKPIYEQIIARFEFLIAKRQISLDEPMPSVRSLSAELSVNPNTLQKAYCELERRGLCYTVPGNGRYVAKNAHELLMQAQAEYFAMLGDALSNLQKINVDRERVIAFVEQSYSKIEEE